MICSNQIFNSRRHLSPFALAALKAGSLPENELILVTTHIAQCLDCANAFADSFADNELKEVPIGFMEEIENRLAADKTHKGKNLFFYSLRVGLAVCASLTILLFGTLSFHGKADAYAHIIKPPDLRFTQSINTQLRDFSQKLLNMEVFLNETKKR